MVDVGGLHDWSNVGPRDTERSIGTCAYIGLGTGISTSGLFKILNKAYHVLYQGYILYGLSGIWL